MNRHKHDFHGLWWTFGPYGRQDVHVHDCYVKEDCDRVLIGPGRMCDSTLPHHRETLAVKREDR